MKRRQSSPYNKLWSLKVGVEVKGYSFFNLGAKWGLVVNRLSFPGFLYKRLVCPNDELVGCEKSHPYLDSILGPSSPHWVPKPTIWIKTGKKGNSYDLIFLYPKVVPLQAWSGPEGSRKLWFPDFMTTAQDGGKAVSLMHRLPLPLGNARVRGWLDLRAIVPSERFYVNENLQWHQLGSNKRSSDL